MENNNDIVLESFISFCEEMEIVEEGFSELKDQSKICKKKCDLLKIKIHKADGNVEEQCKYLDELKKLSMNIFQ